MIDCKEKLFVISISICSNMFLLFLHRRLCCIWLFHHLHSNMFLLFLRFLLPGCHPWPYLHSNMFLLFPIMEINLNISTINLHSNMFLLFRMRVPSYEPPNIFTFQYVSIISENSHMRKNKKIGFTFQYVSIISESRQLRFWSTGTIYIPICFYYFDLKNKIDIFFATFTFQYVSIISTVQIYLTEN